MDSVVCCTDLSGKDPHRQACVGLVVTSGSLLDVMAKTLVRNARDVGLSPTLGMLFRMLITLTHVRWQLQVRRNIKGN